MTDPTLWTQRQQEQADAFDAIGNRYDEAFPHKEGQLASVERLLGELEPGSRVLDVGCGTGLPTARQLVEGGHHVVGTDISPGMLEIARGNVPEADFQLLDIMDVDKLGGGFDAVVGFFSLLMLPKADIPLALELLHDAIKPGGKLALSMVEADLDDVQLPFLGAVIRVTGYPRATLREVIEAAGFTIEHEDALSYEPADAGAYPEVQVFLHCRRD